MDKPLEKIDYRGMVIKIFPDNGEGINPRDDDNYTTMIFSHKRYSLGDKHDYKSEDYNGWTEMKDAIIKKEKPIVIRPVFMLDHSGITIRTVSFNDPWDSGQIGFVIITRASVLNMQGWYRISPKRYTRLSKYLEQEVERYDAWLRGDVVEWAIFAKDSEDSFDAIETCGGYIGDQDYAIKDAKASIDSYIRKTTEAELYENHTFAL
jgi:hypothetical protein